MDAEDPVQRLEIFLARISSVCCTRTLLPAFCSPSDNWSMQPGQPVTTVCAPVGRDGRCFFGIDLHRSPIMMNGKGSAKSTAGISLLHFHETETRHRTKKLSRLADNSLGTEMAGVMVGNFC